MISQRKEALLSLIPEEKREQFQNKDLDVLEFVVSEISSKTPSEPNVHNQVRGSQIPSDWTTLPKDERKANWGNILRKIANRKT